MKTPSGSAGNVIIIHKSAVIRNNGNKTKLLDEWRDNQSENYDYDDDWEAAEYYERCGGFMGIVLI